MYALKGACVFVFVSVKVCVLTAAFGSFCQ